MPEPKRPLKVFLCHAHADRDPVRGLYSRLTQDGVDAWLDKEKLLPGQDWELEIRKAVREADVVVVCLSKQFNQAGFRQKEVRLALDTAMEKPEGEIFIIPARLEECDNLESLRKWHWVDLFEDDGYEMLMRALRARADRIGATLQIKKTLPPFESPIIKKVSQTPKVIFWGFIVLILMIMFTFFLVEKLQTLSSTNSPMEMIQKYGTQTAIARTEQAPNPMAMISTFATQTAIARTEQAPNPMAMISAFTTQTAIARTEQAPNPMAMISIFATQTAAVQATFASSGINPSPVSDGCISTSDMGCFTIQTRDPNNSSIKVPGVVVTFTRHDNGDLIFSGTTDGNGEVKFLCPIRPVYYDFTISGFLDGSSCSDFSGNSIGAPAHDAFMWLQPANPGGSGKCNWGNDR